MLKRPTPVAATRGTRLEHLPDVPSPRSGRSTSWRRNLAAQLGDTGAEGRTAGWPLPACRQGSVTVQCVTPSCGFSTQGCGVEPGGIPRSCPETFSLSRPQMQMHPAASGFRTTRRRGWQLAARTTAMPLVPHPAVAQAQFGAIRSGAMQRHVMHRRSHLRRACLTYRSVHTDVPHVPLDRSTSPHFEEPATGTAVGRRRERDHPCGNLVHDAPDHVTAVMGRDCLDLGGPLPVARSAHVGESSSWSEVRPRITEGRFPEHGPGARSTGATPGLIGGALDGDLGLERRGQPALPRPCSRCSTWHPEGQRPTRISRVRILRLLGHPGRAGRCGPARSAAAHDRGLSRHHDRHRGGSRTGLATPRPGDLRGGGRHRVDEPMACGADTQRSPISMARGILAIGRVRRTGPARWVPPGPLTRTPGTSPLLSPGPDLADRCRTARPPASCHASDTWAMTLSQVMSTATSRTQWGLGHTRIATDSPRSWASLGPFLSLQHNCEAGATERDTRLRL